MFRGLEPSREPGTSGSGRTSRKEADLAAENGYPGRGSGVLRRDLPLEARVEAGRLNRQISGSSGPEEAGRNAGMRRSVLAHPRKRVLGLLDHENRIFPVKIV